MPHLMSLLRDEFSPLRGQAAAALARMGQMAVRTLVAALKDDRPSVRSLSAQALGDIGSREAVAALIEMIRSDHSGAKAEAVEAAGKIGDPAAIDAILSSLSTGSPAVRRNSVAALARFRDQRTVNALLTAVVDHNEEIRQIAAAGLGEIGDKRVLPQLERAADGDPSSDMRAAAVRSIEQIRARERAREGKNEPQKPS